MVSRHKWRVEKTARRCVRCQSMQLTAVNHMSEGWKSSFSEASLWWKAKGKKRRRRPYLSFSFTAPLCLLVCLSRSLWLSILHTLSPQTHVNNSLSSWPFTSNAAFLPGNPYCLPFSRFTPHPHISPTLIIPMPSIHVFLPQTGKMNSMSCSNIPCTHAHIHIPVCCQCSLLKLNSNLCCALWSD